MAVNFGKTIISLCDYSGNWPKFYREAGYDVRCFDLKTTGDVRLLDRIETPIHGILAAPPCTAFSGSGAQYWPAKDANGETAAALAIVDACLRLVALHYEELAFWSLENPVGRLKRWLGDPRLIFDPCDYGDPYTKKTLLWGKFNTPAKNYVEPVKVCSQGSWLMKLGGKSEKTKTLRSMTPLGFAKAFFEANP
jgi:hypothetical protein